MEQSLRTRFYRAATTFLVAAGAALMILAVALTVREILWPPVTAWPAWTRGTIVLLSATAVVFWVVGALLSTHAHRQNRDSVRTFLTRAERERVATAIRAFESRTSGEIRVHLAERAHEDPTAAAARAFERLGMSRTRDRNGVLFYVAVRERRFAVIGDAGIHAAVPGEFWSALVAAVEAHFAQRRFAEGLLDGIARAGERLAAHFPPRPGDVNELPDAISHGPDDPSPSGT